MSGRLHTTAFVPSPVLRLNEGSPCPSREKIGIFFNSEDVSMATGVPCFCAHHGYSQKQSRSRLTVSSQAPALGLREILS
jgi:hypothetical protein